MSHGLTETDKMFAVKNPVWHGLGKILKSPPTSEEAIKEAGLDWRVDLYPMFIRSNEDIDLQVPEKFAVVRNTDMAILGTVGKKYTPLQNNRAFDFFDPLVEMGVADYETAGSLLGGQRVWILAKLKGEIEVGKDDVVDKYVLLFNSHDGLWSLTIKVTPIRVVCYNTLSAALIPNKKKAGTEYKVRHTKNVEKKTEEAIRLLDAVNKRFDKLSKIWKAMSEFKMPAFETLRYIEEVFPLSEDAKNTKRKEALRAEVATYILKGQGQTLESAHNTLWGAYNGVTNMVTHNVSERRGNTLDKHVDRLWNGNLAATNDRAFAVAMDFLKQANVSIDI